MTFGEWGAAYAFQLPKDSEEFVPFDQEEKAVFEEMRARKQAGDKDGGNESR